MVQLIMDSRSLFNVFNTEMEVINIADNNLADLVSKNINVFKGPTYIRLDKGIQNFNNNIKYNLSDGFNYT